MSLFSWLGRTIGLGTSSQKFWASWAGTSTWAGEPVTVDRAMTVAAVWRAIRIYAETISTLPIDVYKIGADGKGVLVTSNDNPYRAVLKVSPNSDQTPVEFWEGLIGCMVMVGDGFARKIRVSGRLASLLQLDPTRMTVLRGTTAPYAVTYRYNAYDGTSAVYQASDIFHLKNFGFGGDRGMSMIQMGAQSMSSTLAADKVAGKMFRSGLSSSGFLETAQALNEPDRNRLQQIMSEYQGSDNAGKLMILEGGMKYNAVSMSAADAQLLDSRGFNIEEVARWFGLPPILLGHSANGQTMWGTGVEQIIQAWYTLGLRAVLTRIEAAIAKRIFEPQDQGRYYVKFAVEGLLRGDATARAALYASGAQNGWMTRGEIRDLEELPRTGQQGEDELTAQSNLLPLSKLGEIANGSIPAPGAGGEQIRNLVRNWLGVDEAQQVTARDLADIRVAIDRIRREREADDGVRDLRRAA